MADDSDAGEKTEEASQHRIDEARKKGDVAYSKELNSVIVLAGALSTLLLSSLFIFELFSDYISWLYGLEAQTAFTETSLTLIFKTTMILGAKALAPIVIASVCLSILTQVSQIGFLYSPDVLQLKFDRVNPLNGFKRLFSKKSVAEAVKGVFKFAVVLSITYSILSQNITSLTGFLHTEVQDSFGYGKVLIFKLSMSILLGLLIVAIMDFAWEKYSYAQKMKMTKQQTKEEHKEKDGNPEVKQKIRSLQRQMASKRMMADIPRADVIITNPTHISIAIKYDAKTMVAPEIIGKGSDYTAIKIRELAKEHNIPIVENVPLARALYKTVKVGEGVPRALYKAVAEILAFVYKLKKKRKALA
jgi:flagellar biosynthetic protein FlhB